MRFLRAALFLALAVAGASCKQGLNERCQIQSDCEDGLVCSQNCPNSTQPCCREPVTGGPDAGTPDAASTPSIDAARPDAARPDAGVADAAPIDAT